MNPTPSPEERPEPPEGYREISHKELLSMDRMPDDLLTIMTDQPDGWEVSANGNRKVDEFTTLHPLMAYATRTPLPETGGREEKCLTCEGTGKAPAMVDTATGQEPCPYIIEDCHDYSPHIAPGEASPSDKDAEIARLKEHVESVFRINDGLIREQKALRATNRDLLSLVDTLAGALGGLKSEVARVFWTSDDGKTQRDADVDSLREDVNPGISEAFDRATTALAAVTEFKAKQ